MADGEFAEWERQLNAYAALLRRHGFKVSRIQVCAVYRDWRQGESLSNPDYPPRAETIPLPVWLPEAAEAWMAERVEAIKAHEAAPASDLPPCSDDEMWARPDTWAVMKDGNKRASRVLDSEEAAEDWAAENMKAGLDVVKRPGKRVRFDVVKRPGKRVRCEDYCPVRGFCAQWRAYQEQQEARDA